MQAKPQRYWKENFANPGITGPREKPLSYRPYPMPIAEKEVYFPILVIPRFGGPCPHCCGQGPSLSQTLGTITSQASCLVDLFLPCELMCFRPARVLQCKPLSKPPTAFFPCGPQKVTTLPQDQHRLAAQKPCGGGRLPAECCPWSRPRTPVN